MAVAPGLRERVGETRAGSQDRVFGNAELAGDVIGGLEADAGNITREEIGIGTHFLDRLVAVGLINPHSAAGADAIGVEENHDLPHDFLFGPGCADRAPPFRADSPHLLQPHGLTVDNVEHTLAKFLNQLLGIDGSDAFDETTCEVFFDSLPRGGCARLEKVRLELRAMVAILNPSPLGGEPFPRIDARGAADDSDQVALSIDFHPHNAKSRFLVVKSDPLD